MTTSPQLSWWHLGWMFALMLTSVSLSQQPEVEVVTATQRDVLHGRLLTTGELVIGDGGREQRLITEVYGDNVTFWQNLPTLLEFHDLDGDGTLELVVVVSTSGVSCCSTLAVAYQQDGDYTLTDALYRKYGVGFNLRDANADGLLEVHTLNTPFNSSLGGADVVAFMSPLQILAFQDGQLVDVTRDFPELLRAQINDLQADLSTFVDETCEPLLAGTYLASKYLLAEGEQGWHELAQHCWLDTNTRTLIRSALVQFNYVDGFSSINPQHIGELTAPLDWSLELSQNGETLTSAGDTLSLAAAPFTVNITLPGPNPILLNLSADSTNYQQLFIGEDVTSRDNELFSLATGIAELDFGQCYCLTVDGTASHYLFYDSDDLHRFNAVASVPGQVSLQRVIDTLRIDDQDVPIDQIQGRYYLTAWVDYRNENILDADELHHIVLDIGQP